MKCKVNVTHLQIEKYENGAVVKEDGCLVEMICTKGEIIDLPPEKIKRLGTSVTTIETQEQVNVGQQHQEPANTTQAKEAEPKETGDKQPHLPAGQKNAGGKK